MEWKHDCKGCKKPIDSPANALLAFYALFPKIGAVYWHPKCFASKTREAQKILGSFSILTAGFGGNAVSSHAVLNAAANMKENSKTILENQENMQRWIINGRIKVAIIFGAVLAFVLYSVNWQTLDALMRVGVALLSLAFLGIAFSTVMFFVELGKFKQIKAAWLAAQGKTMKS